MGTSTAVNGEQIIILLDPAAKMPDSALSGAGEQAKRQSLSVALRRERYGKELKFRITPPAAAGDARDDNLVDVLVRAHATRETLLSLKPGDVTL